jgi:hypothetical protein
MKLFRFIGMLVIALMTFTANASGVGLTTNSDLNDQVVINDVGSYDLCAIAISPVDYAFTPEEGAVPIPIGKEASYNYSGSYATASISTIIHDPDYRASDMSNNNNAILSYRLKKDPKEYKRLKETFWLRYRTMHINTKYLAKHETYKSTYLIQNRVLC